MTLDTTVTNDQVESGIQLLPRGIEESHFKALPDGWLLTIKRPFSSETNWLVTDAQKPAIAARIRAGIGLRYASIVLWMASILFTMTEHGRWSELVMLGTFAMMVVINASDYLSVRPFIRSLPSAPATVTSREQMESRARVMSLRALIAFTIVCIAASAAVIAAAVLVPLGDTARIVRNSVEIAIVSGLLFGAGLYWARLLVIKRRA